VPKADAGGFCADSWLWPPCAGMLEGTEAARATIAAIRKHERRQSIIRFFFFRSRPAASYIGFGF
jgi:hypothetical protein